jgi:hypothetical protein
MTDKEIRILILLADAWNEFLDLPMQHNCDSTEMMAAIHRAQHLVMIRETRRTHPTLFDQRKGKTL